MFPITLKCDFPSSIPCFVNVHISYIVFIPHFITDFSAFSSYYIFLNIIMICCWCKALYNLLKKSCYINIMYFYLYYSMSMLQHVALTLMKDECSCCCGRTASPPLWSSRLPDSTDWTSPFRLNMTPCDLQSLAARPSTSFYSKPHHIKGTVCSAEWMLALHANLEYAELSLTSVVLRTDDIKYSDYSLWDFVVFSVTWVSLAFYLNSNNVHF